MIHWFQEKYGIEIFDSNIIELRVKDGPKLEYIMVSSIKINNNSVIWTEYVKQNLPPYVINYFNKIIKNRIFL